MERKAMTIGIIILGAIVLVAAGYVLTRGHGQGRTESGVQTGSSNTPSPAAEVGRQHINQALDQLYPVERDHRFGLSPDPGEDEAPIAEIVAYRASKPIPHWHYITYGLSELGEKSSNDPSLSGFGVEYTLRLIDDAAQPLVWPMNLLRWLAKLVWQTREPLDPSHSMDVPDGLLDEVSPGVEGLGFLKDEDLGTIETPNGSLTFVSVIPLMAREHWLLGAWDFDKYIGALRSQQGDVLWRVGRSSVLEGNGASEILARVKQDGSSQSLDFTTLSWTKEEIELDQVGRTVFTKFLRHRLAYGRDATIVSGKRRAALSPGDWKMECTHDTCELSIPQDEANALADDLIAARHGDTVTRSGGAQFRLNLGVGPDSMPPDSCASYTSDGVC